MTVVLFINLDLCHLGARDQLHSRSLLPHKLATISHRFHLLIAAARIILGPRRGGRDFYALEDPVFIASRRVIRWRL